MRPVHDLTHHEFVQSTCILLMLPVVAIAAMRGASQAMEWLDRKDR